VGSKERFYLGHKGFSIPKLPESIKKVQRDLSSLVGDYRIWRKSTGGSKDG